MSAPRISAGFGVAAAVALGGWLLATRPPAQRPPIEGGRRASAESSGAPSAAAEAALRRREPPAGDPAARPLGRPPSRAAEAPREGAPDSGCETVAPPPAGAAARDGADDFAHGLGGFDDPALAARLRSWRAEHERAMLDALAEWQRARASSGDLAAACAAFNRRAAEQARSLEREFGRPTAERLARAGGLHRAHPETGEIVAVDLDGVPLPPRFDPAE